MALTVTPACVFEDGESAPARPLPEVDKAGGSPIVIEGVLAPDMRLDGTYRVVTHFDLTAGELLPEMSADALAALANLRDDPSETLVTLLTAANVPIVSTVIDLVPDVLQGALFEIIDEFFFEAVFDAVPVTEQLALLIEDMAAIATEFEVVSKLEIAEPGEHGATKIGHELVGIAFRVAEQRYLIEMPPLAAEQTRALPIDGHAVRIAEQADGIEEARVYVDDHAFGLPLGALALQGIDSVLQKTTGATDLRDALGLWMDCSGLGDHVASACPLGGCGALGDAVEDMCNSGLDLVVDEVESRLLAIHFESIHFVGGEAALYDRAQEAHEDDGTIDRIDRGRWDLVIARDTEDAPIAAVGTFEGYRMGVDLDPPTFDLIDVAQRLAE